MPLCKYYNRPAGENFHDLCLYNHPPHNSGEFLGLSLKFCIQSRRPYSKPMTESFDRLERDIRLKYFFATSNDVDPDLDIIPNYKHRRKLYVKSKWIPPVACKQVEDRIRVFEKHIVEHRNFLSKVSRPATNLSKIQLHLRETLRQDNNFHHTPFR